MTDKTTKWMIYESIKIILLGIIAICAIYMANSEHNRNNPPIVQEMEFVEMCGNQPCQK